MYTDKISTVYIYSFIISERIYTQMQILKWQHAFTFFVKSFNSVKEHYFYCNINRNFVTNTSELNVIVDNENLYDIFISFKHCTKNLLKYKGLCNIKI